MRQNPEKALDVVMDSIRGSDPLSQIIGAGAVLMELERAVDVPEARTAIAAASGQVHQTLEPSGRWPTPEGRWGATPESEQDRGWER